MTVFANLVNGEIRGVYDLLPKFWNGINNFDGLALNDDALMRENNFVRIVRFNPPLNENQKLSDWPTYTVVDGNVIEHREIIDVPPAPAE